MRFSLYEYNFDAAGIPASYTVPSSDTPSGGWQFYVEAPVQGSGSGTYTVSVTVSLRDAGGTALISYSFTATGTYSGKTFSSVSSFSSSFTPSLPTRPNPNSDVLSRGLITLFPGVTRGQGYENYSPFYLGSTPFGCWVYVWSPVFLLVVPNGAYVSLDSYSLSVSTSPATSSGGSLGGRAALRPHAAFAWTASDRTASVDGSTTTPSWDRSGAFSPVVDPDQTIVNYAWNYGDGGTDSGSSPTQSHAFDDDGNHTVNLVATDNYGGSDSVSQTVNVFLAADDSVHDQAGNLFAGLNSGTAVRVNQFPAGVASKILRATIANSNNPSLARMPDGRIFMLTHNNSGNDAVVRVSHDNARTFA